LAFNAYIKVLAVFDRGTDKNALKDISTSERLIDFATSYYESLLDGYREGVVSTSELMDAHVALAASKVEHLNALYDYKLSMARLLEASGMSADIAGYMLYNEM
jgi:outer membrane protein TolC